MPRFLNGIDTQCHWVMASCKSPPLKVDSLVLEASDSKAGRMTQVHVKHNCYVTSRIINAQANRAYTAHVNDGHILGKYHLYAVIQEEVGHVRRV